MAWLKLLGSSSYTFPEDERYWAPAHIAWQLSTFLQDNLEDEGFFGMSMAVYQSSLQLLGK